MASALLGITSETLWNDRKLLGQLLETFVYQELRKYADWQGLPHSFFYFRNKDKVEIDIVIERGKLVAGVVIKAAATVAASDFKGLKKLKEATGNTFAAGVVFYDGENIAPFGDRLFAVPVSLLIPGL